MYVRNVKSSQNVYACMYVLHGRMYVRTYIDECGTANNVLKCTCVCMCVNNVMYVCK